MRKSRAEGGRGRGVVDEQSGRERGRKLFLPLPFWYLPALSGLGEAHPRWGGWSALLSLPIQTSVPSRNTLADTPRNSV